MTLEISSYIKQGSASADNLKFVRVDSTQAIKKDAVFTRKPGVFNASINTFSVPEYRMIVRADVPTAEGLPTGQRVSADLSIRLPVAATKAQLTEALNTIRDLINQDDFDQSVVQQLFPCESECVVSIP